MKQSWKYIVCTVIVMALTAFASAQSLGETARQERAKQKPQAAKVITNEDIPSVDTSRDATTSAAADKKDDADSKDADKKKELSADDKLKEMAAWKSKVAAQDAKVKDVDREINLMEREHKLREAVFYADAGSRVRDERTWFDQERKYQADLATKQKNLAAERNKLDDLKNAARKAGVGGVD